MGPRRQASRPAQAKDLLYQAVKAGQVIELTLDPDERPETIKVRYRSVANAFGYTVRFHTRRYRPYRDELGMEREEAAALLVFVTPDEAVPHTQRIGSLLIVESPVLLAPTSR
jgi:hypothetical protein